MFYHFMTVCMYVLPLLNILEYNFGILNAFRPSLLHYVGSVCCQEVWQVCYDWIVLDRRIALDRAIWKLISPCTLEAARFLFHQKLLFVMRMKEANVACFGRHLKQDGKMAICIVVCEE